MNALEAIGVIFFLTPFINNTISRITKSPKLFFHDTGLLCYLLDINSELELFKHPNYGHIFETFVVSEINKSFINSGESMNLYYLQDKDVKNKEIDVIIEKGNRIYPIEIKTTSLVNKNNFKNFNLLKNNIKQDICPMIVVGTGEFLLKIDENKIFFPA
jgi:predicted AAA+ superfamily ATPase